MLGVSRTDRPQTTPHPQSPERFRDDRSPPATAPTHYLLGALATTNNTQTTASTNKFLGVFGLTNNLRRTSAKIVSGAS